MQARQILLWLNSIEGMSLKKKHALLKYFGSPEKLFDNINSDAVRDVLGEQLYAKTAALQNLTYIAALESDLNKARINYVDYTDEKYSALLKEIDMPPIVLYYQGNLDLFDTRTLAVVGTRKPTRYGKDITEKLVRELVYSGITIVSGVARGVDTIAHRAALAESRMTIGVIANGLDIVYPPENAAVYAEIRERGLLISEYPPGYEPKAYRFPERNRIISGLSEGVLVTEAGDKSGSLITLECALEQGRELFLVPGNINSAMSIGINKMIKNCQGSMVAEANDILREMNIAERESETAAIQLDFLEERLVDMLSQRDLHFEEILEICKLNVSNLTGLLTRLQLLGIIKKLPGNYYGV